MPSTLDSTKVYARVALLRRKVLLRRALRRAAAGVGAALALLVAISFGTRAAYLALVPRLGDLGASAAVAGGYLLLCLILALIALREPKSDELAALETLELQARQKAGQAFYGLRSSGLQAQSITGKLVLAVSLLNALRRILRARKDK